MNPLLISDIEEKLEEIKLFKLDENDYTVSLPKRDIEVLEPKFHRDRESISSTQGQIRLLHNLASIELQAAELGVRTLIEFKDRADINFLNELLEITKEEAIHCGLCLKGLKDLGGFWGMHPCHLELWKVSKKSDTLLERILKVHRYLEGSGLDATFSMLNKFKSFNNNNEVVVPIIERIANDEVRHVKFGSDWFKKICADQDKIPFKECRRILFKESEILPKRRIKINLEMRKKAGFSIKEVEVFKNFQEL